MTSDKLRGSYFAVLRDHHSYCIQYWSKASNRQPGNPHAARQVQRLSSKCGLWIKHQLRDTQSHRALRARSFFRLFAAYLQPRLEHF